MHTHRRRVFNMVHRLLGVSILIHGSERVSVELIFFDEQNQVLGTPFYSAFFLFVQLLHCSWARTCSTVPWSTGLWPLSPSPSSLTSVLFCCWSSSQDLTLVRVRQSSESPCLPSILPYTSPLHSLLHISTPFSPTHLHSILPYTSPLHSPLHISPPFPPTYLPSILPYISSLSSTCFIASCTHLCSQFLPL